VEKFKHMQSWEHALHSRFDCYTGDAVTEDDGWGHLQVRRLDIQVSQIVALGLLSTPMAEAKNCQYGFF